MCLGLGAMLAGSGIVQTIELAGAEPREYALFRSATCLPLLFLTAVYGVTALRAGTTRRALAFFPVSYVLLGVTIDFEVRSIVKRFAPSEPTIGRYLGSMATVVAVAAGVALLAFANHRVARARASPPT